MYYNYIVKLVGVKSWSQTVQVLLNLKTLPAQDSEPGAARKLMGTHQYCLLSVREVVSKEQHAKRHQKPRPDTRHHAYKCDRWFAKRGNMEEKIIFAFPMYGTKLKARVGGIKTVTFSFRKRILAGGNRRRRSMKSSSRSNISQQLRFKQQTVHRVVRSTTRWQTAVIQGKIKMSKFTSSEGETFRQQGWE